MLLQIIPRLFIKLTVEVCHVVELLNKRACCARRGLISSYRAHKLTYSESSHNDPYSELRKYWT